MARRSSTSPGCAASAYRGWKQPASPPASDSAAPPAKFLDHDIDDPIGHDDHLAGAPIIHRPDDAVEGKRGAFDLPGVGVALDPQFAALLAIDLRDIGNVV